MRMIDADALLKSIDSYDICDICAEKGARCVYDCPVLAVIMPWWDELIDAQPTIETKQIKYFDEDEKVWKIGSVIVDE